MVFPPLCMPALFHDALAKHLGSQPPELFMNLPIGTQVFINSGATILLGVSVGGKHRCGGRRGGARRHAA